MDRQTTDRLTTDRQKKFSAGLLLKWTAIILLVAAAIGYSIDVDYYLMRPGSAEHLQPLIHVEGSTGEESGRLMLTTVSSLAGNALFYVLAQFDRNTEIVPKEDVLGSTGMDDELYQKLMIMYMNQSQQDAIYNAFLLAGEAAEFVEKAVLVRDVTDDSKAKDILKPGDSIIKVDGFVMKNSEQVIEYVKSKQPGDLVAVTYERSGEQHEVGIELTENPETEEARIGVMIFTERELHTEREVQIDTGQIGGSSAGTMFTLEIYKQLIGKDITKGHYVAGTGTINTKGQVGQIGGVQHKVKAAYAAKADIFFVPKDILPTDSNEKDAVATNEQIGSPLVVVPIAHVQEAIDYLEKLPVKQR